MQTIIHVGSNSISLPQFPLITKPINGMGGVGVETHNNEFNLKSYVNPIRVQSYIKGIEYNLDILNDHNGDYVGVCIKRKLARRAGATCKCELVYMKTLEDVARKISKNTKHIGSIDIDVIIREDTPYVIDINPRIGGGFPFSIIMWPEFLKAFMSILSKQTPDTLVHPLHNTKARRIWSYEVV